MNKEEVIKLSKLARIEIGDAEAERLAQEFEAILGYVSDVKNVTDAEAAVPRREDFPLRNIMRDDEEPHESGLYTEKLLAEAPASENGYVKVKKIL